jgi:hypothetical protein
VAIGYVAYPLGSVTLEGPSDLFGYDARGSLSLRAGMASRLLRVESHQAEESPRPPLTVSPYTTSIALDRLRDCGPCHYQRYGQAVALSSRATPVGQFCLALAVDKTDDDGYKAGAGD